MNKKAIFEIVDHTLLNQTSTWAQIKQLCDDACTYHTASVCIPPSFVKQAKEYLGEKLPVCTVIGFPNGYNTTATKVFETKDAIQNGADEIDMVINIGWVKEGQYDLIASEINAVKDACDGKLLKVIIETCLLSEDEKINMCKCVSASNADYIKTSTGFSTSGATFEDIALFAKNVSSGLKIKAAGGIQSFEDATKFIELGANRLGTSRIVNLAKDALE
ncbi:MAG: deoxyribose-phosphate aldolase [Lachnospiraceae bacterium]|nr:deoxyribose-phosphate aldolase [Lachnospiraceae bacterium]